MLVTGIRLYSYRSYDRLQFEPSEKLNVIIGQNAAGKTNILEAIYLCAIGRSFRTRKDNELINMISNGAYVALDVISRGSRRKIEFKFARNAGKQILIDGEPIRRMGELMGVLNAVLFSPEDLSLVKDSPEERRRFMDMELCQLRPAFFYKLQQYILCTGIGVFAVCEDAHLSASGIGWLDVSLIDDCTGSLDGISA